MVLLYSNSLLMKNMQCKKIERSRMALNVMFVDSFNKKEIQLTAFCRLVFALLGPI